MRTSRDCQGHRQEIGEAQLQEITTNREMRIGLPYGLVELWSTTQIQHRRLNISSTLVVEIQEHIQLILIERKMTATLHSPKELEHIAVFRR